jgi:hypothetical protein
MFDGNENANAFDAVAAAGGRTAPGLSSACDMMAEIACCLPAAACVNIPRDDQFSGARTSAGDLEARRATRRKRTARGVAESRRMHPSQTDRASQPRDSILSCLPPRWSRSRCLPPSLAGGSPEAALRPGARRARRHERRCHEEGRTIGRGDAHDWERNASHLTARGPIHKIRSSQSHENACYEANSKSAKAKLRVSQCINVQSLIETDLLHSNVPLPCARGEIVDRVKFDGLRLRCGGCSCWCFSACSLSIFMTAAISISMAVLAPTRGRVSRELHDYSYGSW